MRHRCSGFACDGNGPLCHLRAERTLIPALAAAVSCVLPSIRFCLNSLVCRSVINGTSVPNNYPISTGKNGRRYRQDQLSLITLNDELLRMGLLSPEMYVDFRPGQSQRE